MFLLVQGAERESVLREHTATSSVKAEELRKVEPVQRLNSHILGIWHRRDIEDILTSEYGLRWILQIDIHQLF